MNYQLNNPQSTMKTVTTIKGTFMFVEVPDGQVWFFLPKEGQKLIGQLSTITEYQAMEVVEAEGIKGYKHYWKDNGFVPRGFAHIHKEAIDSLRSLIKSEGLDPAKDYVILKINK